MDNHSKNAANETQKFLEAKKYDILQWPSESPDLNREVTENSFSVT